MKENRGGIPVSSNWQFCRKFGRRIQGLSSLHTKSSLSCHLFPICAMGTGDFQVDRELWTDSDSLLFFVLLIVCIHWAMKFTSHWLHLSLLFCVIGDCFSCFHDLVVSFFSFFCRSTLWSCLHLCFNSRVCDGYPHCCHFHFLCDYTFISFLCSLWFCLVTVVGLWFWIARDLANRPLLLLDCVLILINNRCQSLHKSARLFLKTITWSLASYNPNSKFNSLSRQMLLSINIQQCW